MPAAVAQPINFSLADQTRARGTTDPGIVTATSHRALPAATAPSRALPPRGRIPDPPGPPEDRGGDTPWRASTSERPCASHPCARDPGTASMAAPGFGASAEGVPNAFGDCAVPVAAQMATIITAARAVACALAGRRSIPFDTMRLADMRPSRTGRHILSQGHVQCAAAHSPRPVRCASAQCAATQSFPRLDACVGLSRSATILRIFENHPAAAPCPSRKTRAPPSSLINNAKRREFWYGGPYTREQTLHQEPRDRSAYARGRKGLPTRTARRLAARSFGDRDAATARADDRAETSGGHARGIAQFEIRRPRKGSPHHTTRPGSSSRRTYPPIGSTTLADSFAS